jgi:hypothetical protein
MMSQIRYKDEAKKVAYYDSPISDAEIKQLRAGGYELVDAKYAPDGLKVEGSGVGGKTGAVDAGLDFTGGDNADRGEATGRGGDDSAVAGSGKKNKGGSA